MRFRWLSSLTVGFILMSVIGASGAMAKRPAANTAAVATQPPPSLMIQLSSLAPTFTPADLAGWLDQICQTASNRGGDLVLQDVATSDGTLLTGFLDRIVGLLPGMSPDPCFGRVFVGTVEPSWSGSGSPYVEGIQDSTYVSQYLALSGSVASQFVSRYPRVTTNFYISYEANLNELYYPQIASAYTTMLSSELESFRTLRPASLVTWSPAFWYPYSSYSLNTVGMAGLTQSLTQMFYTLNVVAGGIQVLDLQDYVAGSACQPVGNQMTPQDAVNWVQFLQALDGAPRVTMNTEQYAIDCATGGIGSGSPTQVLDREAFYRSSGVTLGAAFEIRYWMVTHGYALAL
jgi:hypothetical protein